MDGQQISSTNQVEEFFREKNIEYLKRSRIEWKPLLTMKLHKSPYYKENRQEFLNLDARYGKDIDSSRIAPVYIQKIDDKIGYGLFALKNLKKGDFIGEYTGVIRECEEVTETFDDGSYETDFSWDYPDETGKVILEINGRLNGNELRFVNHDKNDNLAVEHTLHDGQWLIFFVANRDISTGEQLLVSYGEEYWSGGFRQVSEGYAHEEKS